ncbi:TetR/AcrR family transcriptional regulator [Puerhibacterium puerhi]|uniref:TetR/AcrR family transcriptional regulator n=1 Tax=Puerhibacterium puerhi TaxID=2692623 RepID=UPI001356D38F|nr:TetR family transcriptional regulator [Puerhibacterium puerhi]
MGTTDKSPASDAEAHVRRLWRHRGAAPPSPRRGPRPQLALDAVLDAAVALADAEGLAGVSTRAVAARVGVSAMGLYPYVGSKEQLVALMQDHASVMPAWDDAGPALADDVEAWALRLFDLHVAHPWLAEVPWAQASGGPQEQDWLERLLAVLERHGIAPPRRAAVVTALYATVRASAQTAAAYRGMADGEAAAWRERAAATRRLVPDLTERYPRSTSLPPVADDWREAPREGVRQTVRLLCRGLEADGGA